MRTALSADEIRVRAYLLWEGEGRQSGRDEQYWHEAILQLERERVSEAESASIGVAASPEDSTPEPAKRSATTKVGKAVPANVGQGANGDKTGEKSRKATGERQKKADLNAGTKSDTKAHDKAPTKTEAKAKVKKKADAPAAASKQATKSRRIKEDTGQAQANKAP
jgi:hypothetical protein